MIGGSTIARSRRGLVAKPIKRLQKGQLDDVASRTLELVAMRYPALEEAFAAHTLGLQEAEFTATMLATVFSERISTSEFYLTQGQAAAHVQYLFEEVDSGGIGRVSLEELMSYLKDAHWRYVHRREQRTKLCWNPLAPESPTQQQPPQKQNDRSSPEKEGTQTTPQKGTGGASPPPPQQQLPPDHASLCLDNVFVATEHEPSKMVFGLKESKPRPQLIVASSETGDAQEELTQHLQDGVRTAAMTDGLDVVPFPTAITVLPELGIIVIATTCNNGSHLHIAAPETAEILHTVVVDTHQSVLGYDPTSQCICGGSSLGEVSFWSYNLNTLPNSGEGSLENSRNMERGPGGMESSMLSVPTPTATPTAQQGKAHSMRKHSVMFALPDAQGRDVMEVSVNSHSQSHSLLAPPSPQPVLKQERSMSLHSTTSHIIKAPVHFEGAARPHNGPVIGLRTMMVHAHVASVGADGKIALTDPLLLKAVRTIVASPKRAISACAFDSKGHFIATCTAETTFQVWHGSIPENCEPIVMADEDAPHEVAIVHLALDEARHHVLSLDCKGTIKVWDPRLRKCLQTFASSQTVNEQRMGLWKTLVLLGDAEFASCSDRSTHLFQLQKGDSGSSAVTQCEVLPVSILRCSSSCSVVVAASKANVRLFNTGSGALQQSFENVALSRITSCGVDEVHHVLVVGEANGDVAGFDVLAGLEKWRHHNRHAQAVTFLECGGGVVFSCGAEGVITSSRGPGHPTFVYEAKQVFPLCSFFLDAYEVFGISTKGGTLDLYEVAPDAGNDDASNVLKAHSYEIGDALTLEKDVAYTDSICFLGSIGYAMAAEGTHVTMLSLSTAKVSRIASWPTPNASRVTYVGFLELKNQLIVADEGGHLIVYDIGELLKGAIASSSQSAPTTGGGESGGSGSNAVSPPTVASFNFKPFDDSVMLSTLLLRQLGVIAVTGENLECNVFRPDGVKKGILDMFTADGDSWGEIAEEAGGGMGGKRQSMARRRSTVADLNSRKMSMASMADDDPLAASNRKIIPRAKHRAAMVHGVLPQVRKTRMQPANAFVNTLSNDFRMSPNMALRKMDGKPASESKPFVRPKQGESSNRTQQAREPKDAKWTLDYVPPKEPGPGQLMALRQMTKGLLPSAELVEEYQRAADARFALSESPMKDTSCLHGTPSRKPHRLQTLGRPVESREIISQRTTGGGGGGGGGDGSPSSMARHGATTPSPLPLVYDDEMPKTEQAPQWMKHHGARQAPTGGGFRFYTPSPTPSQPF